MKKLFTASVIFLAFGLISCKWYTIHRYQLNKPFSFEQKSEFINHLKKKRIFNIDHILYLEKESYVTFLREKITQDSTAFYIGTYINDSTKIEQSESLNKNTSCIGRIENEIKNNCLRNNFFKNELKSVSKMSGYKLKYLSNNKSFDINTDKKPNKIFLTYTTRYGKWYDRLYKEINEIQKKNKLIASVYLVCIDQIFKLP